MEVESACIEKQSQNASTQFSDARESTYWLHHLERYCCLLPLLLQKCKKTTILLTKRYLMLLLTSKQEVEASMVKKANQFVSLKFGVAQVLDILLLEQRRVLFLSWKSTKLRDERYFPYQTLEDYFLPVKPLSANSATTTTLKALIQIFRINWWWYDIKRSTIETQIKTTTFNWRKKTIIFKTVCGNTEECVPPKTFMAGMIAKTLLHR